jgi:hypothetical protein
MSALAFVIAIAKEIYRGVWLFELQTGEVRIEFGGREYHCSNKAEAKAIIDQAYDAVVVVN